MFQRDKQCGTDVIKKNNGVRTAERAVAKTKTDKESTADWQSE